MQNYVLNRILEADYTRRQINYLIVFLCSFILRYVIDTCIYLILRSGSFYLDFVISVIISVIITALSDKWQAFVLLYETSLLSITNYIIDNYSYDNYKYWQKRAIASICLVCICYLSINSNIGIYLKWSLIHFLICCFIYEQIENWYTHQSWPGYVRKIINDFNKRPKTKVLTQINAIDESYIQETNNIKDRRFREMSSRLDPEIFKALRPTKTTEMVAISHNDVQYYEEYPN